MRNEWFDPYIPGSGPLHRLPSSLKLAAALVVMASVVVVPRELPISLLAPAFLLLLAAALSRVSLRRLFLRLLLVEPFAIGVALLALFQPDGLRVFLLLLARSTLCLLCVTLLSATTRFTELLAVLRRLRIPSLFITTLALAYRYLFVLSDEAERMNRARRSRSFGGKRRAEWRTVASIAAHLFTRSTMRAERIYAAMCARGWQP